jgi:hypothetical protein
VTDSSEIVEERLDWDDAVTHPKTVEGFWIAKTKRIIAQKKNSGSTMPSRRSS